MGTSVKTIEYMAYAASAGDNTWQGLSALTVYIPESSVSFKSVFVEVFADDKNGSAQSVGRREVRMQLGAAAVNTVTNTNGIGTGSENFSYHYVQDFTSYFTSNWSGTSMTCQIDTLQDISTVGSAGTRSITARLYITYEYDDTSSTQIKTVAIPLNGPTAALATSKTSYDTIPDLASYLPEASKSIRQIFIHMAANRKHTNTTDFDVNMEIDSNGVVAFPCEAGLSSNTWSEWLYDVTSWVTTGSTHTFNLWLSVGASRCPFVQSVMYVTYEYDESTTTSVLNSVELNDNIDYITKSTTDFIRNKVTLQVQEESVTLQRLAANLFWSSATTEANKSVRIGSGSFQTYTIENGSTVNAGQSGLMIRNDSPTGITFARGEVELFLDIAASEDYATHGYKVRWFVNYTSDKASGGTSRHNHTVKKLIRATGTSSLVGFETYTTADSIAIPETNYRLSNFSICVSFGANNGTQIAGTGMLMERLSGEGGAYFEVLDTPNVIPDTGVYGRHTMFAKIDKRIYRWAGDTLDGVRMDPETARRFLIKFDTAAGSGVDLQDAVIYETYHSITSEVAGDIADSNGGTVTISLHRDDTGEKIAETSRTGDGAYSLTCYDDTLDVFVQAYEDGTYKGRSAVGNPTLT